ncbi:MAG: choice-of-anchor tandem repeat GloVer-containing protein [Candidatus Korobacteraceae bacterium]
MDSQQHPARFAWLPTAITGLTVVCVLAIAGSRAAPAQTFTLLHTFTGGTDGKQPETGMTLDQAGNLYGTTFQGGTGYGTVFRLSHRNSGWVLNPLYAFRGGTDGNGPLTQPRFGPDGTLYGTTQGGGNNYGTVFNLRPPATVCAGVLCPWTETQLYAFTDRGDSEYPQGNLAFDPAGNLYGAAAGFNIAGGYGPPSQSNGSIYELIHAGGTWTVDVLWAFPVLQGGGYNPEGGVILDQTGKVYGTTVFGGDFNDGTVFVVQREGFGWDLTTLHSFNGNDGRFPQAGLVADSEGNFYGATSGGGRSQSGVIFEMTPSNGGWNFKLLYQLHFGTGGLMSTLAIDAGGNLYGSTYAGGQHGQGNVFKLSPSGGTWTYTDLYDFTGGSDGYSPIGGVTVDAAGNIYGTASEGGTDGAGTTWEITQ